MSPKRVTQARELLPRGLGTDGFGTHGFATNCGGRGRRSRFQLGLSLCDSSARRNCGGNVG